MVVHLFGQCADMDALSWARPTAFTSSRTTPKASAPGKVNRARAGGHAGGHWHHKLFPSKNLGALGDGGAVMTRDEALATRMKRLANHGAERKYTTSRSGATRDSMAFRPRSCR